jgi:hypothetical protein
MNLLHLHAMSFKPTYSINSQHNCGEIKFKNESILCDTTDMMAIINNKIASRKNAINFLFDFDTNVDTLTFINNNINDIRRENVTINRSNKYSHLISSDYIVSEYIDGHMSEMGAYANKLKNPKWRVHDTSGKELILMYCETDTICILCPKSHQIVLDFEKTHGKKITWYCGKNNYIIGRLSEHKLLYIHQVITGCYGNGKGTGTISVDHENRNPLDNRFDNLRIATRKQQEDNSSGIMPDTKRTRQTGARELPDGITQDMLKKYVVYYVGYLNADRTKWRDFFAVEHHPALCGKTWTTTKSMKVSAYQKLMDANKAVDDLNNGIMPTSVSEKVKTVTVSDETVTLPKYIRISNARGKPHLELDKRNEGAGPRISLKMVLPETYEITTELSKFIQKVITKYPELTSLYSTKNTNAEEDNIL